MASALIFKGHILERIRYSSRLYLRVRDVALATSDASGAVVAHGL